MSPSRSALRIGLIALASLLCLLGGRALRGSPAPETTRYSLPPGGGVARGPQGAKVTIVEFADPTCPHSAAAHDAIERILDTYPGQIRHIWRFVSSPKSETMAVNRALWLARDHAKFWPTARDVLRSAKLESTTFKQQIDIVKERTAGVLPQFCGLINRPAEQEFLLEIKSSKDLGLTASPSIFVNGLYLEGAVSFSALKKVVRSEMRRLENQSDQEGPPATKIFADRTRSK
jgi:protein-disulfide isomerase